MVGASVVVDQRQGRVEYWELRQTKNRQENFSKMRLNGGEEK